MNFRFNNFNYHLEMALTLDTVLTSSCVKLHNTRANVLYKKLSYSCFPNEMKQQCTVSETVKWKWMYIRWMKIGSCLSRTVYNSDTKGQAESYCYSHSSPSALNTNFLTCQVPRWTSRRMFDRRRLVLSKPDRNFINMGLGKMDRERGKSIGSSASSDRAVSRWPGEEHARVFLSPPVVLRLGACVR